MQRRLGAGDAVVIGLGSMVGAGVFSVVAPAARAAGGGLLIGLALAAIVAYCNATSSAQLAALHPTSGGTYVYGRARLGPCWGRLAGWSFVIGKTASWAAIALTFGAYVIPGAPRVGAVLAVAAMLAVNLGGITRTVQLTRVILVLVALALLAAVIASLFGGRAGRGAGGLGLGHIGGLYGVLQAGGLFFFAFAGYARIATLAEEVDRELPGGLAAIGPRHGVPQRAESVAALLVVVALLAVDLRGAIAFSSVTVLTYYGITNAAALKLSRGERTQPRALAVLGLIGSAVLVLTLPLGALAAGAGTLAVVAAAWALRHNSQSASGGGGLG